MRLPSLRRFLLRGGSLPFDMFDVAYSDAEARRARRMESIYHVGQARIRDGREVLKELVAKKDLRVLGVDPRGMLGIAFCKQADIDAAIKAEFPLWPDDPPVRRVFEGACEALFPSEGPDARVPLATRVKHAFEVVARARPSVVESWGTRPERKQTAHAA
jgi:hypothetical protein